LGKWESLHEAKKKTGMLIGRKEPHWEGTIRKKNVSQIKGNLADQKTKQNYGVSLTTGRPRGPTTPRDYRKGEEEKKKLRQAEEDVKPGALNQPWKQKQGRGQRKGMERLDRGPEGRGGRGA